MITKIHKLFLAACFMSSFTPQLAFSQLCPNVSQTYDDGETRYYDYRARVFGDSNPAFELQFGDYDGHHALYIDSAHVFDENESGLGGSYANWHLDVSPFYLDEECAGLDPEDAYDCIQPAETIRQLSGGDWINYENYWYGFFGYPSYPYDLLHYVTWHSYLPGPYKVESCEWYEISDLGRNQKVNYQNLMVWDWDDFCLNDEDDVDRIVADYPSSIPVDCDGYDCIEARGCADGVRLYIFESDEGWFDDYIATIYILRNDKGEIFFRNDDVHIKFYNGRGPSLSAAEIIPMLSHF